MVHLPAVTAGSAKDAVPSRAESKSASGVAVPGTTDGVADASEEQAPPPAEETNVECYVVEDSDTNTGVASDSTTGKALEVSAEVEIESGGLEIDDCASRWP